ncbi:LPS translocon maturation chaperone LptM [Alteromonas sp. ASW11-130]
MFKKLSVASVLIYVLLLSACGYRAALYLPEEEVSNQQTQQTEAPDEEVQ